MVSDSHANSAGFDALVDVITSSSRKSFPALLDALFCATTEKLKWSKSPRKRNRLLGALEAASF